MAKTTTATTSNSSTTSTADPAAHSWGDRAALARSWLATFARFGLGGVRLFETEQVLPRPVLFERFDCPYSRRVREAMSLLGLDVVIQPCRDDDEETKNRVRNLSGQFQIPYLIDAEKGFSGAESDAIIVHLMKAYGAPWVAKVLNRSIVAGPSGWASKIEPGLELSEQAPSPQNEDEPMLELWTHEASPTGRLVRRELHRIGKPYLLHFTPHGSSKRKNAATLVHESGFPLLKDPVHSWISSDTEQILRHLRDQH